MKTTQNNGVYIIADDRLYELAVAFLNSFRLHNPDMPLCLIPYNDQVEKLRKLGERYNFTLFPHCELLHYYDQVSRNFHPEGAGHYRKLAAWQGPFERFIYMDIDTVVLSDLSFNFKLLDQFDFITSTSQVPGTEKWVWKNSAFLEQVLSTAQLKFAANTGFIASHKNLLTTEHLDEKLTEATRLKRHMELFCFEQPLLNYLMVTSGKSYTSLNKLALQPDYEWIPTERWAGDRGGKVKDGTIYFKNSAHAVLFLHWAGEWQVYPPERKWIRLKQMLGILPRNSMPLISKYMPYKKLWNYYRYLQHT